MSPYQTLRQRINQYCPYLFDLKFGCEIKTIHSSEPVIFQTQVHELMSVFDPIELQSFTVDTTRVKYKILGTPPTLTDVLVAIQTANGLNDVAYYAALTVSTNTQKLNIYVDGNETNFDLTKPLSNQPLETINFLLSIIPEKK